MRLLIGIDDTDNLDSRGTGFHARQLAASLAESGLASVQGISRHQLLFDRRIPYTSHNSSLCLELTLTGAHDELLHRCREYLLLHSAPGSDAGLCVVAWDAVPESVQAFGQAAKREILTARQAQSLAAEHGLILEGLTGDHGGVIGALAATGLRRGDHDGRFVWRRGIRELRGICQVQQLLRDTGIDELRCLQGGQVLPQHYVDVEPWPRPVLLAGRAVLLVSAVTTPDAHHQWQLVAKDIVKQY